MNPEGAVATGATQVYEDFVPTTELVQEQDFDTLLFHLTVFKREQVSAQLTITGIVKISGQMPVVGQNKSLRFQKEFPVSENYDKTKISAKFENCILYVKQPKLITSSEKKDQELPTANAQQPKKPADEPQPQKKDEEQAKGEKTPTPSPTPTPTLTPTEEVPRQQTNADKPEKEERNTKEDKYQLPTANAQQPKKPTDEPQPQKKDEEQVQGEKTPTPSPTEEVPRQQTNADKLEKEEPNTKEAKDLPEQTPAEKTGITRPSYASKFENNAMIGTATALAEKLKMPRKVMNMSLIALLVLGISLYVCRKTKKNEKQYL